MRILIVDDSEFSREVVRRTMAEYGECVTADDGAEALEAFSEALEAARPFHLVFMDILMPRMDGHETLQAMREMEREREAEHPVIAVMITALDQDVDMLRSFVRENASAYIVKPLTREKIIREMQRVDLLQQDEDGSMRLAATEMSLDDLLLDMREQGLLDDD